MKSISILIIITALLGSGVLTSCNKNVLDKPLELDLQDSVVFRNIVYSTEFVTDIYSGLPNGYKEFANTLSECATDDARHANPANDAYRLTNGSWGPTINPDEVWSDHYKSIRKCNRFLEEISMVKVKDHGNDILVNGIKAYVQRDRLIGEVYFLRAFYYSELAKRYGGVPIVTKTLNREDEIDLPRNTFDEVVNQITKDCDSAFNRLPATYIGTSIENYYGRATKWASAALKARILLYAASPLNNPSNDANKWLTAADAAKPFFDASAPFTLPNGISSYEGLFRGNTATNTEIIWSRLETNQNYLETANYPVGIVNGNGGVCPSQYLVDAYEMANGKPITDPTSGYNSNDPYIGRDPRFAVTILFNGATYKSRAIETFTGGVDGPPKVNATLTGYYMRKHLDPNLNLVTNQSSQHNWVYFRLAEMLLNYAESRNEADATPGNDVYTAINRIRNRVGMPSLPAGLTKQEMRDRIRNERRIELSFEGHRYWDARRWDIAKVVFNRKMRGMKVEKTGTNTFSYTPYELENRIFTQNMNRYPIRLGEILANPKLIQNPGW